MVRFLKAHYVKALWRDTFYESFLLGSTAAVAPNPDGLAKERWTWGASNTGVLATVREYNLPRHPFMRWAWPRGLPLRWVVDTSTPMPRCWTRAAARWQGCMLLASMLAAFIMSNMAAL